MQAVILAAGQSSRFKPLSDKRHKALTEVLGKPLIEHTIDELEEAGVDEIIVVQGPDKDIETELERDVEFVVQEEPKGMGHALRQARHLLENRFLVLTPYRARASQFFKPMMKKAEEEDAETVFVSTPTDTPEKYGILDLEDGKAVDIVEKPDPEEAPSDRKVVGMYLLSTDFFQYLDGAEEWEYQFEDALALQMGDRPAAVLEIEEETNSVKYPWDLFSVAEELLDKQERSISEEADIADSAEVKGRVIVEPGATIYENAVVKGPAYIGKNVTVGNNAVIRENTCLERQAVAGANAEVTRSIFQPRASLHSGFAGDTVLGRNSKAGAETVFANRLFRKDGERRDIEVDLIAKDHSKDTGKTYLGAFIGEDVDIGVNVSLMPGVEVGSDARVLPGSVVKKNVETGETR